MSFAAHALNFITTVPPTTTGGTVERAQEAVGHEPWVTILLAVIAGIFSTVAAWFGYLGHERAKEAKATAEEVHATVKTQFDEAVGVANGHGSLMDQTAQLMQNQQDILQAQARQSLFVNESLQVIHNRVSKVDDKIDGHVTESASYRQNIAHAIGAVEGKINGVAGKIDGVEGKLVEHVEWEKAQKYPAARPEQQPRPRKPRNQGGQ